MKKTTKILLLVGIGIILVPNMILELELRKLRRRGEGIGVPDSPPLKETRIKVNIPWDSLLDYSYKEKYGSDGLPD